MKTLIASVLASAVVATAAVAGNYDEPAVVVVDDVYEEVPAASSSGMGAGTTLAIVAGVVLVGAALASASGTD